ncbi:hypothetical protein KAH55_09620, partial [bacterium]|nr:hypothetical protein [bacterium]
STDESRLWVGTTDGLATTADNGLNWHVYRKTITTGQSGEPRTYAFPTPFSPSRMNNLGGDGFVRIQYNTTEATSITLKVHDFAMELIKTVVTDQARPAGDFSEVWNCRNGRNELVANGVYFYSVDIAGDGTYWGKIMIID